ncbi:TRAP transporter permease [Marivita geojedonensis]|uniref:C4-dicarboxylate ABC transporter n=1 Tax=Marivita geojedonensis TaxID=1123756 RepID=A0A1X4NKW0_9RHOB|nr:TRAP transporter permease [Marivita geojedonensis]OSQ50909.1 C4-dicarboxylate ABC transporter [Marivita geojedonensis]PRY77393.1 TRAP transporter 4TM/12TM fusion protein [Marivita geojedonensis]
MTDTKTAEDMVAEADTGARQAGAFANTLIFALCITWSLFQLYIASKLPGVLAQTTGVSMFANIVAQARFVHLAFALALATLAFPIFGHRDRIPLYDWVLFFAGIAACLYLVIFRFEIASRPGLWSTTDIVMSAIGMVVLMIAVYRSLGLPLVIIASLFLALAFFGGYSEWIGSITNYGGSSFSKAMGHYWMQTEGVFGVALGVSTTMIFLFVLFGALLEKAGGGNWFIKVAISLLGTLRGGPAKAAVLSSMMTGMISGSSIANTVTTGTFTIPLMKRIGFSPEKAGAVEVASSTNGQLTPPVMGAAAFLMVEYVNIPYIEVIKHAFLPAVISYIALLYIVHLESLKLRLEGLQKPGRHIGILLILILFLTGFIAMAAITFLVVMFRAALEPMMPGATVYPTLVLLGIAYLALVYLASRFPDLKVDDPNAKAVSAPRLTPTFLGGAYFALPIFVLVWNLMVRTEHLDRLSPALSAFWATIAMIIVALTHRPLKAIFRGESEIANQTVAGFQDFVDGLVSGARNMIGIGVATGAAGIIVGTISLTGAHQIIGQVIETISGGNLIILLVLVAVLSLILGMGLPTTANYIVVSSLMAPVIVSVGAQSGLIVPLIAVHMFVFYFGILADDTPPVGLAAYAAAAISRGDPIKTGVQGFAYDIRTALLPFMFIFNTDLLLIDVGPLKAVFVFFVSLVAMLVFAAVTQGYFFAKNRAWEAVVMMLVVFLLFRPGFFLDRWQEPYTSYSGPAAIEAMGNIPVGTDARVTVSAPDFDTGIVGSTTIVVTPDAEGSGIDRLQAVGLTVMEEGDMLLLEEPFPGTPFFETLANEYDFYGDAPAQIEAVQIENDRMPKEIFFIPAFILLLIIIGLQSRRMTQPAF